MKAIKNFFKLHNDYEVIYSNASYQSYLFFKEAKKYGIKKDPIRRMALHANYMEFIHPKTKEKITIPAAKYPTFSASKALKESVNK